MADTQDRLRAAIKASKLSQRAVERAAGLHTGHLSVILGRAGSISVDTAEKLAPVLGVTAAWLLTGEAPQPAPKSLPPAPFAPIPLDAAIDAAFDAKRHRVSDALAVRQVLASGLTLTRPAEAEPLARAFLDAAAWLREQGARVTRDALLEALAARVVELAAPRAAS